MMHSKTPVLATLLLCGCGEVDFREPEPSALTLGEAIFAIVRNQVAASPCTAERLAVLDGERDRYIESIDRILTDEAMATLAPSVREAVVPLVMSGELPALTDSIAGTLALLVDDAIDPDREALTAALALGQARSLLPGEHVVAVAGRLAGRPDAQTLLIGITGLALEHDGVDYVANTGLEVLRGLLDDSWSVSACPALPPAPLDTTLLAAVAGGPALDLGLPAFAVRADRFQNPAVATDPSTGSLYAPFVDTDGDGSADIDAQGWPVDASGGRIALAAFGWDATRDAYGRALAPDGRPIYRYVDAKETPLSYLAQLAGEAITAGAHHDLGRVMTAVLGAPAPCSDGSPDCWAYAAGDHPLADLAFLAFEALRFERVSALLETWANTVATDRDLAETALASVGLLVASLQSSDLSLTDPALFSLVQDMVPLTAELFAQDNTSGESTARLMLRVFHDLGAQARDFPQEMAVNVGYAGLVKTPACSDAPPDLMLSTPVDYSLPRYAGPVDNRSLFEQSVELLAAADGCYVPLSGKTIAELLIETMAGMTPSTVCTLTDTTLALAGLPLSESVAVWSLDLIGCDGQAVWNNLQALDGLAKSGALDVYLPLAQVLVDRGQVRTLLDMGGILAADLGRDEDADPGRQSVLRRAEPALFAFLASGAALRLLDVVDLLFTIPAADGSGNAAELWIDAVAALLDRSDVVETRQGPASGTSLAEEMLASLALGVQRIETAGAAPALARLANFAAAYMTASTLDDRGTPDPSDDVRRLDDGRLLPLFEPMLGILADRLAMPPADVTCFIDALQADAERFLTDAEFATIIRLVRVLDLAPQGPAVDTALAALLTPWPGSEVRADLFGAVMQTSAGLIASADATLVQPLLRFFSMALDPERLSGRQLFSALHALLTADRHGTFVTLVANALDQGSDGRAEPPGLVLAGIVAALMERTPERACQPLPDGADVASVEAALRDAIVYLEDDEQGLGVIYALIRLSQGRRDP